MLKPYFQAEARPDYGWLGTDEFQLSKVTFSQGSAPTENACD
ncbi:hypothetical protein [Hymenobacter sp. IS2118]|nr:hypothetical protein [Hymenobacter sp. IS2118]